MRLGLLLLLARSVGRLVWLLETLEDDVICIKVGGCSELSQRATERRQEQLPFPKFFQEECMSACLPARSPYFQQLPPLSRGEARGDPVLYGRGCGHQLAGCPIKGSITCFVWNYKQKQESRRNQKHHPARAPSMDGQDLSQASEEEGDDDDAEKKNVKTEKIMCYAPDVRSRTDFGFGTHNISILHAVLLLLSFLQANQPASRSCNQFSFSQKEEEEIKC